MKRVLVACGAAVATSTVVAKKIEKLTADQGVNCVTYQAKASEVKEKIAAIGPDIVVCTCQIDADIDIPVMNGRAFLTGINLQKTTEELMAILKKA
ncbi:MAG: PTS sugar transporter subunit IIB [Eubacterium sp.]|nr:PTS sugar transporter subunit IIB [Eubacterium sp.]